MTTVALRLAHFTPLPPAQSGIADYSWRVIEALRPYASAIAVTPTSGGQAPEGVPVRSLESLKSSDLKGHLPIYQVGNNWLHTGILRRALEHPGLVILHDLQLFYLHEGMGWSAARLAGLVRRSNPALTPDVAFRLAAKDCSPKLPYLMSNMLRDLLDSALHVVVHSQYARVIILRHFGPALAERISVIPHFAMPAPTRDRTSTRAVLGLADDDFVVLTAGFATRAKQMDLLASVLDSFVRRSTNVRWVHAGKAADGDFNLEDVLRHRPALSAVTRLTGYLPEEALDDYVCASDVLVNMRFPSVGESSGSLARALAAGACAIVSDTGGYAELPADVVVHVSPLRAYEDLRRKLTVLHRYPSLRRAYGEAAARYAATDLSMDAYVQRLVEVLKTANRAPRPTARLCADVPQILDVGPMEQLDDRFGLMPELEDGESGRFVENPKGRPPGVYFQRRGQ